VERIATPQTAIVDSSRMPEALRSHPHDEALVRTRRRQIFLAACRVLARKSFHEATVKEIALEAGLAAGSIYVYLQGKDDILLLLVESMVGELVDELPAIRERTHGDPRRELLEVMRTIVDVIDRYREAFTVLHHEVRYLARRPRYREAFARVADQYTSLVAEVLERGKRAGVITFTDQASVVEAIHMLCSGWAMGAGLLKDTTKETYWREIAALVEGRFFASVPNDANVTSRKARDANRFQE
jgi:AcrR family transcriptional regulator